MADWQVVISSLIICHLEPQVGGSGGRGWKETSDNEGDHERLLQGQKRRQKVLEGFTPVQDTAENP